MNGTEIDLGVVNGGEDRDAGVEHGARLVSFVEAVMREDADVLERERRALREVLSPESFVDVAATIAAFNTVDRVANATGIPLDAMLDAMSGDFRSELNLERFASAANTPQTA